MKLLAFAASHRKESVNRKLAKLAAQRADALGAEANFVEYGTFDLPIYDDESYRDQPFPQAAQTFAGYLRESSGIILASPEYNWSFPGSLKNLIDWASSLKPNPFEGKTALLLSASPSRRGGAQGLVHLGIPLMALGVFVFPHFFTLSHAEEAFDKNGGFKDKKRAGELDHIVTEFLAMTSALGAEKSLLRSGRLG